jgi:Cu/Ag efflux protein CusF
MKTAMRLFLALALLVASAAYAEKRPREGKVVRIAPEARIIMVQGEKGDTWDLHVTETTKMKGKVVFEELHVGDEVEFEYVEREGQMFLTELEREHRAKH